MHEALGLLETTGYTPAMLALDAMQKAAAVEVLQAEINDFLGIVIKIVGSVAAIEAAIAAGHEVAQRTGGKPVSHVLPRPDAGGWKVMQAPPEFNPLIQQDVVHLPSPTGPRARSQGGIVVADSTHLALGFIETQGFTAVFEAIDQACKAADVEVVGKEKLGGGYVTVVVRGDVAAVKAAVEAGQSKVSQLGKLIAAHVIARPSAAVLSLLPK